MVDALVASRHRSYPDQGQAACDLKDAADYIMALPKKVHDAPHWRIAMEQLIDAAEGRNFIVHARRR